MGYFDILRCLVSGILLFFKFSSSLAHTHEMQWYQIVRMELYESRACCKMRGSVCLIAE